MYPSIFEGFGLPVLESISHGKPCVCTPFGALSEVAEQGGCLLIEDGEPDSIAAGIRRLLEDDTELDRLTREANERPHRGWDNHADEILGFIDELNTEI